MKHANLRQRTSLAALAAIGLLGYGCGATSEPAPGAVSRTTPSEIPGTHSPNDLDPITAQRFVDDVHVGRALDANGKVPRDAAVDRFTESDPIFVAMQVIDAPAGSAVRLEVLEETTEREVWNYEKKVDAGDAYLNFEIDAGELPRGEYRARVIVGDETVANRSFSVGDKKA